MSLQSKIIVWFVVYASLTIILIGVGGYYQSSLALRYMLQARADALALQMSGDVERSYERNEAELVAIGYAARNEGLESLRAEIPNRYTRLRVIEGDSLLVDYRGAPRTSAAVCAPDEMRFDVALPPRGRGTVRVEAVLPVDRFFANVPTASARLGEHGLVTVLQEDGRIVFDAGCNISLDAEAALLRGALAAVVRTRAPSRSNQVVSADLRELNHRLSDDRLVALVRSQHPAWITAVAVDYGQFAAPFLRRVLGYVGLLVLVVLAATAIVVGALRRDMGRLSSIARAADAIGHGRFDVWLPPPTSDEVGHVSLALGRMVERLRATMQQMEITRSMAAVGELSTYLSHEVRNPLSSIRLNLQMLRRDLASGAVPHDAQELVGYCLTELQRLDQVVSTVLKVGKPAQRHSARGCDAHVVVHETIGVMQGKLRDSGVVVSTRLESPESAVAIDSATLHGLLMNLLLNSVDALGEMPEKQIEISTELQYYDRTDRRFALRVRDSGPGVPPELRGRIFDPFFTTKHTGTGIGLSTALRAAQDSGGTLYCTSRSDWRSGAEFVLELPVGSPSADLREARTEALVGAGAA